MGREGKGRKRKGKEGKGKGKKDKRTASGYFKCRVERISDWM